MIVTKSPVKHIREMLHMTQTQFAAIVGVSTGHTSEVESGIAPLGDKLKGFLKELFINDDEVERKHQAYMDFKRKQYRAEASRAVQAEAQE